MRNDKVVGKHAFYGSCMPGEGWRCDSFSVGVFEWVSRANGKGVKRGPVKVRVRGRDAEKIKARAREIVDALDAGDYEGPKTVSVN